MIKEEYIKILAFFRTLDNLLQSDLSEIEVLLVKSFLLVLRKYSLLVSPYEFKNSVGNRLATYELIEESIFEDKNSSIYSLYYEVIHEMVLRGNDEYLHELYVQYFQISHELIEERGVDLFDFELSNSPRSIETAFQPVELTRLINHFCDVENTDTYYNPFAGLASLSLDLPSHFTYFGEEIREKIQALGRLRILMYESKPIIRYDVRDSLTTLAETDMKFDFIGFNPPYNLKLNSSLAFLASKGLRKLPPANSFIISKCFDKLKSDGRMVFIMPSGFLFSRNRPDRELKENLIDKGHLEKIIALPRNIFKFSGVDVNLLVVNKKENKTREIEFIDATQKFFSNKNKARILDVQAILNLLTSEESSLKRTVGFQEIKSNEFNLSVNRYVFEDLKITEDEKKQLTALKELVTPLRTKRIALNEEVKFVRIRDLADSSLDAVKSFDDVDLTLPKYKVSLLEDQTLLLATMWRSLKPTLYRKTNNKIYFDQGSIFGCRINESKVDSEYLLLELQKDYVGQQLRRLSVGSHISRMHKNDLLKIKIALPSLEIQRQRKLEFKESLMKEQKQKLESLKEDYGVEIADENSFLRHKISGTLNNVRGTFNKLKNIIDLQLVKDLPEIYSYRIKPGYPANFKDYLDRLERDINSIHRAVKTAGLELSIREMNFRTMNFIELVQLYLDEVKNRPNCNFEIWFENDYDALKDNKIKEILISCDPEYLFQAFDNIIENAQKHGFGADEDEVDFFGFGNVLEVSLFYDFERSEVQLNFCNTGKALPENFSQEAFVRKGSKAGAQSGEGIGGWLINEIVKSHRGRFEIRNDNIDFIDDEGSMFPTRLILTFPMEYKI